MRIQEELRRVPTFYSRAGLDRIEPLPCTVVYIHPEHRFYVVEFRSDITGETWREAFFFSDRMGRE